MTVNQLMQVLADAVRKGLPATTEVVTPDELPIYLVIDERLCAVYVTDVDPNSDDEHEWNSRFIGEGNPNSDCDHEFTVMGEVQWCAKCGWNPKQ